MPASFPTTVWNGASVNRDPDKAQRKAPNWQDYNRLIAEMVAVMNALKGVDAVHALHTIGAMTSKTGLTLKEIGTSAVHKTVFTFDAMEMVATPGSNDASDGAWGTQTLYTFPVGHIAILGAHLVFPLGKLIAVTGGDAGFADAANFEIGVGTVASAQWTGWGLNNATQEDIATALDVDLTTKTSDEIESIAQATVAVYDGSGGAIDIHLNFRTLGAADFGPLADVLKVSGTLTLLWSNLGDN